MIPLQTPITTDFGLLTMAILIGVFFYTAIEFRSPIGVIFSGLTAFTFMGYLNGIVSTDVILIAGFINIIILIVAATHYAS